MRLHLVRHGRPLVDPARPAADWELDPAHFDDVWALRESGDLPRDAVWLCSPEPKAIATAQLLTEGEVGIVEGLREQLRATADRIDDFDGTVRRAFAEPELSAYPGWEPLARTRTRLVDTARLLIEEHRPVDLVLVGHATAWTVLAAALTGGEPDLARWASLGMPDVIVVDLDIAST